MGNEWRRSSDQTSKRAALLGKKDEGRFEKKQPDLSHFFWSDTATLTGEPRLPLGLGTARQKMPGTRRMHQNHWASHWGVVEPGGAISWGGQYPRYRYLPGAKLPRTAHSAHRRRPHSPPEWTPISERPGQQGLPLGLSCSCCVRLSCVCWQWRGSAQHEPTSHSDLPFPSSCHAKVGHDYEILLSFSCSINISISYPKLSQV